MASPSRFSAQCARGVRGESICMCGSRTPPLDSADSLSCVCGVQCATRGKRGVCLRALGEWHRGVRAGADQGLGPGSIQHPAVALTAQTSCSAGGSFFLFHKTESACDFCIARRPDRCAPAGQQQRGTRRHFRRRRSVPLVHPPSAFFVNTHAAQRQMAAMSSALAVTTPHKEQVRFPTLRTQIPGIHLFC